MATWDSEPSTFFYRVYTTDTAAGMKGRGDNPAALLRCQATVGVTDCIHAGEQAEVPDLFYFYQVVGDCDNDPALEGPNEQKTPARRDGRPLGVRT